MDTLEKLKKKRAKLDKDIEMLENMERPIERFQKYYLLTTYGGVTKQIYDDVNLHINNVDQGNAFHTEKEAELEADRRNFLHRFKMFRDKCNGEWKADFEDFNRKYFIIFNADSGHSVVTYQNFYEPFNIFGYFKNESDAIKAITLFGDEIKKLFVDCECD